MKKHQMIFFSVALFLLVPALFAQEMSPDSANADKFGWKNGLTAGLNFNQSQFSNWAKGGENSLAWQFLVNGSFDYIKPNYTVDTGLKINYGRNKVGSEDDRKTTDEFRFDVVYNQKVDFLIDPYAAVRFLSQLDDGFKYSDTSATKISGLLDPAYLTISLGSGYKPNDLITLNIGPSAKGTFADAFANPYTDDPETTNEVETQKWEGGVEFVAKLKWELYKEMLFTSNLLTFTDFKNTETDVNWDNTLIAKVNSWLNFNIQFQMLFDKDLSNDFQYRQALAIGLNYTIF